MTETSLFNKIYSKQNAELLLKEDVPEVSPKDFKMEKLTAKKCEEKVGGGAEA